MPLLLAHPQILEIRAAVLDAGLTRAREELLAGIGEHIRSSLPVSPTPGGQILSDLDALNQTGTLADGTVPLRIWLTNAQHLAHPRKQAEVFARALESLGPTTTAPGGPVGVAIAAEMHQGVAELFVGRADELDELERVLLPGSPMPVAIGALQGMPGVGKSYLADRFAYLHKGRFPGGYVKVSLSPDLPRTAEELGGDLAGKVDLPWAGANRWQQLVTRLQQPRTLVHIENADSEDLAFATAELAARLKGCSLLVSGRSQQIGEAPGWHRVEVRQFQEAAALEQIEKERGVKTSATELEGLKRVARELGYLPLALHLVGGHLRKRSIEGFLSLFKARKLALKPAYVNDPLLLQDKARAIVSTTFELSLDLLRKQLDDRGEAWIESFAMLGHAPPSGIGRSLGAAMAGLTVLEFEELMVEATQLSLAARVVRSGPDEDAWSLHPLLAELLRGKIEGDGRWLVRMTAWFLERLPELPAGQEDEQGRRRTEAQREHDALVSWLALVPISEAARVERAGSHYAIYHGPFAAWLGFCERLLQDTQEPEVRSNALWTLCQVARRSGAIDRAKEAAEDKAQLDRERGAELETARALGVIADIYQARGDLDEALRIRQQDALPVFERLGDVYFRAMTMSKIADIYQTRGDLDEALRILEHDALPVFERLGDVQSRAQTMGRIADIYQARGDLDEALRIRQHDELTAYERLGDLRFRAVTMGKIADIYQARGDLDEALRIRQYDELTVFERLGDVHSLVVARAKLARLYLRRGHPGDREAAAEILRLALRDAEAMRIPEAAQIRALQQKHGLS